MDGKVFEQVTCPGNRQDELVKSELAQSKNVCTANCVILMKHIPIPPLQTFSSHCEFLH